MQIIIISPIPEVHFVHLYKELTPCFISKITDQVFIKFGIWSQQ
jgi:hypothetical protein